MEYYVDSSGSRQIIVKDKNEDKKYVKKFRKLFDECIPFIRSLTGSEPDVFGYLIENCNKSNQVIISNEKLAKKVNLSLSQINKILKKFKQHNFIYKIKDVIILNPNMYMKHGNNEDITLEYMPFFCREKKCN